MSLYITPNGGGFKEALLAAVSETANADGDGSHWPVDVSGGARAIPFEQALELHDLKYWPVAEHPDEKRPIGKAWGLERWTRNRINGAFDYKPRAGVGIGLGPDHAPGGGWLFDFEVDGDGGQESLRQLLGCAEITTPGWTSRRGGHWLLSLPLDRAHEFMAMMTAAGAKEGTTEETKGSYHLAELPGLEIRCGGFKEENGADGAITRVYKQTQSVCPPTCTDGFTRSWRIGPAQPVAAIPDHAFDFLDELIHRKVVLELAAEQQEPAQPSPMAQRVPSENGHERRGGMRAPVSRRMTRLEAQIAHARAALRSAAATVAGAGRGTCHNVLLTESLPIAGFVNSVPPVLTKDEFLAAFLEANRANGHAAKDPGDGEQILESALAIAEPRDLSQIGLQCPESLEDDDQEHDDDQDETPQFEGLGRVDNTRLARLHCTDLGNAERMVARHGANLRFCWPWGKWLAWDGLRWRVDNTAAVRRKAKHTVRKMFAEAATLKDEDEVKQLVKWAQASEQKKQIDAMIALASSEEGVPVLPEDLNRNPWLLNCLNGTVDLKTGELRPNDRADLITVLCPVEFDKDAPCPVWDKCLETVFAKEENGTSTPDLDLVRFWRRLCGLALTGVVTEQILPICWGVGANGKTTLLKTLIDLLGPDYAITAAPGLLLVKYGDSHPTERADLYGKRLVVDMESAEDARLNETLVKQLTGSDRIRARKMREDFWEFEPTHKLIMCTNHKPAVKETKHAIWRRIKLIPFTVKIEGDKEDKSMLAKLRGEQKGILAWAVRGCLEWQKDGLKVPDIVSDATKAYQDGENLLKTFIEECCNVGGNYRCKSSALYEVFRAFTGRSGEGPVSQKRFGEAMTELGYERTKSSGYIYEGIALRNEAAMAERAAQTSGNNT